jgi:hypothetical protein
VGGHGHESRCFCFLFNLVYCLSIALSSFSASPPPPHPSYALATGRPLPAISRCTCPHIRTKRSNKKKIPCDVFFRIHTFSPPPPPTNRHRISLFTGVYRGAGGRVGGQVYNLSRNTAIVSFYTLRLALLSFPVCQILKNFSRHV